MHDKFIAMLLRISASVKLRSLGHYSFGNRNDSIPTGLRQLFFLIRNQCALNQ